MRLLLFTLVGLAALGCEDIIVAPTAPEDFTLSAEYTNGAVNYTLANRSSHTIGTNPCSWGVERRVGANWEDVRVNNACPMILPEWSFSAGVLTGTITLANALPGEYRLVADVLLPPDWPTVLLVFSNSFVVE